MDLQFRAAKELDEQKTKYYDERDKRYRERSEADDRLREERDRRYAEVNVEREKALKIKETADLAALGLAREIQNYKDEKANELREQISSERGEYASKGDLKAAVEKIEETNKPFAAFMASQQGGAAGKVSQQQLIQWLVYLLLAGLVIASYIRK